MICQPETLILGIHIVLDRLCNIGGLRGDEEQTLRSQINVFCLFIVDLICLLQRDTDLLILQICKVDQTSGICLINNVKGSGQINVYLILRLAVLSGRFDDLVQSRVAGTFHLGRLIDDNKDRVGLLLESLLQYQKMLVGVTVCTGSIVEGEIDVGIQCDREVHLDNTFYVFHRIVCSCIGQLVDRF